MKKVFFIGNSHTYFECLPFLFAAVCKQAGIEVHAGMSTHPGCDLAVASFIQLHDAQPVAWGI